MNTYKVVGFDGATFSKDRSTADLVLRTTKGDITVSLRAKHLEQFITQLDDLFHEAPPEGAGDAQAKVRIEMADGYRIGRGVVDGVAYVTVALGQGQGGSLRWYALSEATADQLQRALVEEIPKLKNPDGAASSGAR